MNKNLRNYIWIKTAKNWRQKILLLTTSEGDLNGKVFNMSLYCISTILDGQSCDFLFHHSLSQLLWWSNLFLWWICNWSFISRQLGWNTFSIVLRGCALGSLLPAVPILLKHAIVDYKLILRLLLSDSWLTRFNVQIHHFLNLLWFWTLLPDSK